MFDENNCNNAIGKSNSKKRSQATTSSLLQCQQDIDLALRSLRHRFSDLRMTMEEGRSQSNNSATLPDPTRLISRLTALETSIGFLKNECQTIETKRIQVVQSVLVKQNQNMVQMEQLKKQQLPYADNNDEHHRYEDVWNHIQAEILSKEKTKVEQRS